MSYPFAGAKPRPVLDRCAMHGIWFDGEELAKVFQKVAGKGHGSANASPSAHSVGAPGSYGWRGASGNPEWWGGGHGGSF